MAIILFVSSAVVLGPRGANALNGFGTTRLALLDNHGNIPSDGNTNDGSGNGVFGYSGDGRYLLFASKDNSLVSGDTRTAFPDLFVKDTVSGLVKLVGVDENGNKFPDINTPSVSGPQALSDDGNVIIFDFNGSLYVRDMSLNSTAKFFDHSSVQLNAGGAVVSPDGRWLVYRSNKPIPPSQNISPNSQLYLYDRSTDREVLISKNSQGVPGNGQSEFKAMNYDASSIIYTSTSDNLDANYPNTIAKDVLYDRASGVNSLLKNITDQDCIVQGARGMSYDGSRYSVRCTVPTSGNANSAGAAYYEVSTQQVHIIAAPPAFSNADGVIPGEISPDGNYVALQYYADTPVNASDTNGHSDGAFYNVTTGAITMSGISSDGTVANGENSTPLRSSLG